MARIFLNFSSALCPNHPVNYDHFHFLYIYMYHTIMIIEMISALCNISFLKLQCSSNDFNGQLPSYVLKYYYFADFVLTSNENILDKLAAKE